MVRRALVKFIKDESGAVTVDWVVLTASIVALNIVGLLSLMEVGMTKAGSDVNAKLSEAVGFAN